MSANPRKNLSNTLQNVAVNSCSWEWSTYSTLGVFRAIFIHGAKHTLGDLTKNQEDADMNGISPLK